MIALAAALAVVSAVHVELRDAIVIEHPGATAAYAVDATIADAFASEGQVTIRGNSRGSTQVAVVTADGVDAFTVIVDAPPPQLPAAFAQRSREGGSAAATYDSGTRRIATDVTLFSRGEERALRFHALGVATLGERQGDALAALPNISLAIEQGGRELVLLDDFVTRSPLTLDGAWIRGAHYLGDGLEVHAGVTSPLLYQNFLLPTDPETVLGASYRVGFGSSALTPSVYAFPSAHSGGTRGAIATLLYEYADPSLRLRAEGGFGHVPGGALELTWEGRGQSVWLDARLRPQGMSSLGIGQPHGAFANGIWAGQPIPRLTLSAAGSFARQDLPNFDQQSETGSFEARVLAAGGFTVSAGATLSRADVGGRRLSSVTLPVRLALDGASASASAQVRYQRNSVSNLGGLGGRVDGRLRLGALTLGAWGDLQKDAATVDLVFREVPELARAFAELGLTARTPEELASLLQSNPALAQLGYLQGVAVNLHPWRVQSGAELALSGAHQQLKLRLQIDATQTVGRAERTALASATFTQRLASGLDAFASWTSWTRREGGGWAAGVGVRATFDELPRLYPRSRRIGGTVVDEDGRGMAGARIRLDGSRETVTDASGDFSFDEVSDQRHRVQALAPEGTYFTSHSTASLAGGETARFELRQAGARLSGAVRDDSGAGVAGAVLHLTGGGSAGAAVTTDSAGRYAFAVAPGDYNVSLDAGSLPPGYDAADADSRAVRLDPSAATHEEWSVGVARSISGIVMLTPRHAVPVWLVGTDRKILARPDGAFAFRNLSPGVWIVAADLDGVEVHKSVLVPAGSGVVHVEFAR